MRVLFTSQPGSGHWHPLVPLAQALGEAGHEVAFASMPGLSPSVEAKGFRPSIEAKGFRCFHAGIADSEEEIRQRKEQLALLSRSKQADYMQTNVFAGVRAERSLPDMIDIIREWRPGVVVRENTEYAGCIAAEHAGIPHAAVQITAPRTNFLQVIEAPLKHLCALAGLPPGKPADMLYHYMLLTSRPPSLWNPEVPVPPTLHNFRYAGFNQSGDEGLPDWVAQLDERPKVFATLGTAFNHRTDILSAILDGLREESINLILTVGRNQDPQEFGEQPANVHVERYIPQNLLLPLCDLVVTHGGSGTVMDALSLGLPMVIIPIGADQPLNAKLCAQVGVARVIEPDGRTGAGLAQAVRDAAQDLLRDPAYRENAQRIRKEIEGLPGLEYTVALLERLAAERSPILLQPSTN